jgi:acyl-homoserine lactone acylase PvdQ
MDIISVPPSSKTINPEIVSLRAHVQAAQEEFDLAVVCHEVWKPTAYDKELHQRMGVSYATNAFRVVVTALRREVLLALMRLWDKGSRNIRLDDIGRRLSKGHLVDALAADRAARFNDANIETEMREEMRRQAKEVTDLINDYSKGGRHEAIIEKLRTVRHERLAHRQIEPTAAAGPGLTDEEIESFYQDNSKIIGLLLHLISDVGYNPEQTGEVFRHHASFFWAAVRGERTEGHPNYRPPPNIARA